MKADNINKEAVYSTRRLRMVEEQIMRRGIVNADVVSAMRTVPRHLFIAESERQDAYFDGPISIGHGQTISQPYIVASMTETIAINHTSRVLEVGTGSGYQTAVLAEIARDVLSIEIIPELYEQATRLLGCLGYSNIRTMLGDGHSGWPDEAPFDAVIVTAAASHVPSALIDQLSEGGRMVIPLQEHEPERQELVWFHKTLDGVESRVLYDVRFVPLVGGD